MIGPQDADVQIKLTEHHKPTEEYIRQLREQLPREFPGVSFAFLPADIVSQILNFGSPAPIDLQVRGNNAAANFAYADDLLRRLRHVPGLADARTQQSLSNPGFNVDVDRTRAQYVGLTARDVTNTDVGALISGGTGSGAAMFVISDASKLRLYVNVPQSYVPGIKVGANAKVTVPEYAGRVFSAIVESSSQSVEIASGTTRMQLSLDNKDGDLRSGSYANVELGLTRDVQALSIPSSALIFNSSGLRVATVTADDKVLFKTVTIARDFGREIEIATGLSPDDRVIVTPLAGTADGDKVRIAGGKDGAPKGNDKSSQKTSEKVPNASMTAKAE